MKLSNQRKILFNDPMFRNLENKHIVHKNYKKGVITTYEDEIEEITCPTSFTEDRYIRINTKKE